MTHRPNPSDWLDSYLDDVLAPEDRTRVEKELSASATDQAEIRKQQLLDAALRRIFQPTPPSQRLESTLSGNTQVQTAEVRLARRLVLRSFAIAAILAFGVFGGWRTWRFFSPAPTINPYAPMPWRPLETTYQGIIADGFQPNWVCKDDVEFASVTRRQVGTSLLLAQSDSVKALGWRYANTLSPMTMCLLVTVATDSSAPPEKVIVFLARKRNARPPDPFSSPDLHIFQHEIGSVVLYEVSRLETPRVLDRFYTPGI